MDQKQFNERASRLQEVGKIIEKLPAEIRNEAFGFLKSYISQEAAGLAHNHRPTKHEVDSVDGESLFSKFDHDKPADNARLIAAYLFQKYGSEPFSVEEIKAEATNAGIIIPDRVDMTFINALEKGKKLFMRVEGNKFKPTVHGEVCLKTTYGVKKGTKTRSAENK